jgi:hypothetical protein
MHEQDGRSITLCRLFPDGYRVAVCHDGMPEPFCSKRRIAAKRVQQGKHSEGLQLPAHIDC